MQRQVCFGNDFLIARAHTPLLLNMQNHYLNPHADLLFPLNTLVLKIRELSPDKLTCRIELPPVQALSDCETKLCCISQILGFQPAARSSV